MDFLQSSISFHQIHYNSICTIIFHPNHELSGKHNSCSCVVPSCTYFHWVICQVPNHLKVLVIRFFLFLYIWSKSMLYGIWDENRHEVLMKMMCSNHSNTLLQSLKLYQVVTAKIMKERSDEIAPNQDDMIGLEKSVKNITNWSVCMQVCVDLVTMFWNKHDHVCSTLEPPGY